MATRKGKAQGYKPPSGYDPNELEPKQMPAWKPEVQGDCIEGVLAPMGVDDKGRNRYAITPQDGERTWLPSHAALVSRLDSAEPNAQVYIVCTHIGTGKGNPYEYKVYPHKF